MVETYGVYEDTSVSTEEALAELFRRFSPDGVVGSPATTDLQVTGNGTAILSVNSGFCIVGGYHYKTDIAVAKNVPANATGLPRRDRVVVRADPAANLSSIEIKQGTPAANPIVPALSEGPTGIWEVPLAAYTVQANSSVATSLTEGRWFTAQSGPVPGLSTVRHERLTVGGQLFEHDTRRLVHWTGTGWFVLSEPENQISLPSPPSPFNSVWDPLVTPTARRMTSGMVQINFMYRRKGSTYSAGDDDGSILAEIPSPYRPLVTSYYTVPVTDNNHSMLYVDTSGTMNLRQVMKDMGAGNIVRGNLVYRGEL